MGETARQGGRWRRRLAALGCGMVATLVAGELVARLLIEAPPIPVFPQVRFEPAEGIDFLIVPDQRVYTLDAPATINARGTRGADAAVPKPEGTYRVLGLGDSFAFGVGVRDDETFYARLQAILREETGDASVEVVNAAFTGYWTRQEIDWLESRGLELEPNLVVLQFYWNDLWCIGDWQDPKVGVYEAIARRDPEIRARPRPSMVWADPTWGRVRSLLKHSRLLFALNQAGRSMTSDDYSPWLQAMIDGASSPRFEAAWGLIEQELRRAKQLLDDRGIPFMVTVVPLWLQLAEDMPKLRYQSELGAICARLGIPFLDLAPILKPHYRGPTSLFIPYDGHFNARGHELTAHALHGWLSRHGVPPEERR